MVVEAEIVGIGGTLKHGGREWSRTKGIGAPVVTIITAKHRRWRRHRSDWGQNRCGKGISVAF